MSPDHIVQTSSACVTPATAADPAAASLPQVRELSLAELDQVAGGSPNGTWAVPPTASAANVVVPTTSPNGTW